MTRKKDFPKKLFVYIDEDGKNKYFIANTTEADCADLDDTKLVGVYNLESFVKIGTIVNIKPA